MYKLLARLIAYGAMMAYVIGIAYMIGQFTQHLFQHVVALMPQ